VLPGGAVRVGHAGRDRQADLEGQLSPPEQSALVVHDEPRLLTNPKSIDGAATHTPPRQLP